MLLIGLRTLMGSAQNIIFGPTTRKGKNNSKLRKQMKPRQASKLTYTNQTACTCSWLKTFIFYTQRFKERVLLFEIDSIDNCHLYFFSQRQHQVINEPSHVRLSSAPRMVPQVEYRIRHVTLAKSYMPTLPKETFHSMKCLL